MGYRAADHWYCVFTTTGGTGAAVNADSLPTVTWNRNGQDDGTVTATVTNLDAGRYLASATIPAGYAGGDVIDVTAAATVGGVATKGTIDRFVLDRVLTEGTLDINQTVALIYDILAGLRDGIVAGQAGTANIASPSGQARGSITYDVNGNITASNLTPPAV